MEVRQTPTYTITIIADPSHVQPAVKALLHLIFFHRTFSNVRPQTRDILDVTLPAVDDTELEAQLDERSTGLVRQLEETAHSQRGRNQVSGSITVQFHEKRRKKSYFTFGKADEEFCWEQWLLDVTVLRAQSEADVDRVHDRMKESLREAAVRVVDICGAERDSIPPITTSEANPFPWQIILGGPVGKGQGNGRSKT